MLLVEAPFSDVDEKDGISIYDGKGNLWRSPTFEEWGSSGVGPSEIEEQLKEKDSYWNYILFPKEFYFKKGD